MGRFPLLNILLAGVLLGGVALAQQGLIIEPWRGRAGPPVAVAARAGTAPNLPGPAAPRAGEPSPPSAVAPAAPSRWSPAVVELLVDPWAKDRLAAPPRPRWVPERVEIVDPWADQATTPPRGASGPVGPPRAPIF